jgi:hypothetical protein
VAEFSENRAVVEFCSNSSILLPGIRLFVSRSQKPNVEA